MIKSATLLCFAMLLTALASCQNSEETKATTAQGSLPDTEDPFSLICPIEVQPRFPGCENDSLTLSERKKCADEKLHHFIYTNLKWPRDFCGEGMVVVRFIIEKDGTITKPEVVRDIGGGCGEEALRVVKMMPNWVPGEQDGKPVRMQFNLPVRFKLE